MPETEREALDALEQRLGHRFRDRALLELALTHRSAAGERGSNERLEFLGDAVLGLVVCELLMERNPDQTEGWLSRARAGAVNQDALAARALALGLGGCVRLGRSEQRSAGASKPSILANVLEALIGALYLDAGLTAVRALVERELGPELADHERARADAKTRLQELLQARGQGRPQYRTTETRGPAHALEFRVEVRLGERVLGQGVGPTKRAAEQEAARRALELESA